MEPWLSCAAPEQTRLSSPPSLLGPGAAPHSGTLRPTQVRSLPQALGTNYLASESDPWTPGLQPDLRRMALPLHFPYIPISVLTFHSRGWHFLGPGTHSIFNNPLSAWSRFLYIPPAYTLDWNLSTHSGPKLLVAGLLLLQSWVCMLSLKAQAQHPYICRRQAMQEIESCLDSS